MDFSKLTPAKYVEFTQSRGETVSIYDANRAILSLMWDYGSKQPIDDIKYFVKKITNDLKSVLVEKIVFETGRPSAVPNVFDNTTGSTLQIKKWAEEITYGTFSDSVTMPTHMYIDPHISKEAIKKLRQAADDHIKETILNEYFRRSYGKLLRTSFSLSGFIDYETILNRYFETKNFLRSDPVYWKFVHAFKTIHPKCQDYKVVTSTSLIPTVHKLLGNHKKSFMKYNSTDSTMEISRTNKVGHGFNDSFLFVAPLNDKTMSSDVETKKMGDRIDNIFDPFKKKIVAGVHYPILMQESISALYSTEKKTIEIPKEAGRKYKKITIDDIIDNQHNFKETANLNQSTIIDIDNRLKPQSMFYKSIVGGAQNLYVKYVGHLDGIDNKRWLYIVEVMKKSPIFKRFNLSNVETSATSFISNFDAGNGDPNNGNYGVFVSTNFTTKTVANLLIGTHARIVAAQTKVKPLRSFLLYLHSLLPDDTFAKITGATDTAYLLAHLLVHSPQHDGNSGAMGQIGSPNSGSATDFLSYTPNPKLFANNFTFTSTTAAIHTTDLHVNDINLFLDIDKPSSSMGVLDRLLLRFYMLFRVSKKSFKRMASLGFPLPFDAIVFNNRITSDSMGAFITGPETGLIHVKKTTNTPVKNPMGTHVKDITVTTFGTLIPGNHVITEPAAFLLNINYGACEFSNDEDDYNFGESSMYEREQKKNLMVALMKPNSYQKTPINLLGYYKYAGEKKKSSSNHPHIDLARLREVHGIRDNGCGKNFEELGGENPVENTLSIEGTHKKYVDGKPKYVNTGIYLNFNSPFPGM